MNFAEHFEKAYSYHDFLEKYGQPGDRQRWAAIHKRVKLTDAQKHLLGSFKREQKVLVMAGTWCGDCVEQCPIFDHFAAASEIVQVRYVDRDDCGDLNKQLVVCGARACRRWYSSAKTTTPSAATATARYRNTAA